MIFLMIRSIALFYFIIVLSAADRHSRPESDLFNSFYSWVDLEGGRGDRGGPNRS